jgi:hypothetical protein
MPVVFHDQDQSMGWCLTCHRDPTPNLRPLDKITDLQWTAAKDGKKQSDVGAKIKANWHINATDNCSACHR